MEKILVTTSSFCKYDNSPQEILSRNGFEVIKNPFKRKLTEDETVNLLKRHDPVGMIAGTEKLNENVLPHAKKLKSIARAGAGIDSVDLAIIEKLDISLSNTPNAPTLSVAELTVSLILNSLRGINLSDQSIRKGAWVRPMGNLLHDKKVGIIGCGKIGSKVADLLLGFKCKLIGFDPYITKHKNIHLTNLNQVLESSDIVSLHLPYSNESKYILDKEKLSLLKKNVIIINASRGGLINEEDLANFLVKNQSSYAAIDCFEQEPYNGPLKSLPNVLLTAHIGSYTKEGRIQMEYTAAENLIKQLKDAKVIV